MNEKISTLEAQLATATIEQQKIDITNALIWELRDNNPQRGLELAQSVHELASANHYQKGIAYSLNNLGTCYGNLGKFELGLSHSLEALTLFESLKDSKGLADTLSTLGFLHWGLANYPESLDYTIKALRIYQDIGDKRGKAESLNNMAATYNYSNNHAQALTMFRESMSIYREIGLKQYEAMLLNNIAMTHYYMKNYDDALISGQESLQLCQKIGNKARETSVLDTIGMAYLALEEYGLALTHFEKALELAQEAGLQYAEANVLINIGNVYCQQQNDQKALSVFQQALALAEKIDIKQEIFQCHQILAQIYERRGDFDRALAHYKQFHTTKEAIFNEEADKRLKSLGLYYQAETAKKEAEIYRLKAETELRESEERNRLIVESALDAVITMDASGLITGWNTHAEAIFGWTSQVAIGQLLSTTIIPPQHRKAHRCGLERYLKTGKTVISNKRTEITALHRDEYEFPIELTVTPAKSGQTVIFVAFLRDTTEHKQAEQEKLRLSAIEQELEIAHDIQQSLLPPAKPDWPNLDVVCFSAPAREVGGDLYTYHAFTPDNSSGKYGLVVGDVSGKGMPAALIMAVTLASFQSTVVAQELAPGDLLSTLDKVILPYTDATRQNCAMVYAEIDQDVLRVANAGCITPIVKQSDGSVKWVEAAGLPLGMGLEEDFGYEEATLNVSKGDVIVLTSDGVVEATNTTDELFEFDRLEQVVAAGPTTSAQAMLDHIRAEVNRFIGDMELQDDVTIVVVKV